jgi:predicted metal-binding protein
MLHWRSSGRFDVSEELTKFIAESGFSIIGRFDATLLEARQEVRDMCAADKCQAFGRSWSCPPACGSLEEYQRLFQRYQTGYLFQTVAEMEDPFDYEGIERGSKEHKRRVNDLADRIAGTERDILLLGAGACTLCETCTYPDAPCRFPEKTFTSMEASGLVVYDVCKLADVPYYHGKNTIAFCGCALE